MYYILIYTYIYTRDSSTYHTRCPYRTPAFTNNLVATKIGVALFYQNVYTCIKAFILIYILIYDTRYPYRTFALTNNLVATKIGMA